MLRLSLVGMGLLLSACGGVGHPGNLHDAVTGQPISIPSLTTAWELPSVYQDAFAPAFFHNNRLFTVADDETALNAFDVAARKLTWSYGNIPNVPVGSGASVIRAGQRLIEYNEGDRIRVWGPDMTLQHTLTLPAAYHKKGIRWGLEGMRQVGDLAVLLVKEGVVAYRIPDLLAGRLDPVWDHQYPQGETTNQHLAIGVAVSAEQDLVVYGISDYDDGPKRLSRTTLHAVTASTGARRWEKEMDRMDGALLLWTALDIEKDTIVALETASAELSALNLDGTERWKVPRALCPNGGTTLMVDVSAEDGQVYPTPNGDACQNAYDLQTGALKWTFYPPKENAFSFGGRPLIVRGVAYLSNGYLFAVDTRDGKVLARGAKSNPRATRRSSTPLLEPGTGNIVQLGEDAVSYRPVR